MKTISYVDLKNFIDNIDANKPVLVIGHEMADFDSIGSGYSLTLFLNKIGKNATFLLEEVDFPKLEVFEDNKFVQTSFEEKDYILFMMDMNNSGRMGKMKSYFDNAKIVVNIDHHEDNSFEADYVLSEPNRSATSEMLFDLFKLYNQPLDKKIASLLYSGIITDTNGFTKAITGKTLRVVAELVECGINSEELARKTLKSKTIREMKALAKMIDLLQYDEYHYVEVDYNDSAFSGLDPYTIQKKILPQIVDISGIDNFVFYTELKGTIYCLMYSNNGTDVAALAKKFGGGGHKERSGFITDKFTLDEIKKGVKEYFKNVKAG